MDIVLKEPVISEKSMKASGQNRYTFLVNRKARKPQIAKAVEDSFGVDVLTVQTINYKNEYKRQRKGRGYFEVSGFKKAVVVLKNGQKIGLFETQAQEVASGPAGKVKEKKSLLKGTKVKIEKVAAEAKEPKVSKTKSKDKKKGENK